jgi:hypothetical protein
VIGDDIFAFREDLAPHVASMQDPRDGFRTTTLELADSTQLFVRL